MIATGACLVLLLTRMAQPSPALLRDIASLGGALVLAYVVQASWLVRFVKRDDDFENFAGFTTGIGVAGLVGVFLSLLVAANREAGHGNLLDTLGFAWVIASLVMLGALVTIQPLLVSRLFADGPRGAGPADP